MAEAQFNGRTQTRERVSYSEVTHAQFKDLQKRMDGLEKELDRVNIRLDRVENRMDKIEEKLEKLDDKIETIRRELNTNINELRKDIQTSSNHGNIMMATVISIALAVIYSVLK